jgi:hypothetical protein
MPTLANRVGALWDNAYQSVTIDPDLDPAGTSIRALVLRFTDEILTPSRSFLLV